MTHKVKQDDLVGMLEELDPPPKKGQAVEPDTRERLTRALADYFADSREFTAAVLGIGAPGEDRPL